MIMVSLTLILFSSGFAMIQRGQNLTLMYDRVLQFPDRVNNLYFTFLFVLRAVTKVSILIYMLAMGEEQQQQ